MAALLSSQSTAVTKPSPSISVVQPSSTVPSQLLSMLSPQTSVPPGNALAAASLQSVLLVTHVASGVQVKIGVAVASPKVSPSASG